MSVAFLAKEFAVGIGNWLLKLCSFTVGPE